MCGISWWRLPAAQPARLLPAAWRQLAWRQWRSALPGGWLAFVAYSFNESWRGGCVANGEESLATEAVRGG